MNLKHISLEGAHNFRDLGGIPAAGGRATRWGVLYRSDALSLLTENDWSVLEKRNVRTIIDLRSDGEAASSPVKAPAGIECLHFSLMKDLDRNRQNRSRETILESMKLDYVKTLYSNPACAAQIMSTILERMEEGSVVFLCSAGKDRTGIIAALCLYLCGVSREDIIADYIVSSTYNTNGINKMIENIPEQYLKMIPDMQLLRDCFASKPETIAALLDAFEEKGITGLLHQNGFTAEAQQQFVRKFTQAAE